MGCNGSTPTAPSMPTRELTYVKNKILMRNKTKEVRDSIHKHLGALDHQVVELLRNKTIRLLDANRLRDGSITSFERRQNLDESLFLSPEVAAQAVESGSRCVGVVSHSWRTRSPPDPDGSLLGALVSFLKTSPDIKGIFMDFCSLFQHPRTPEQQKQFTLCLDVMGDLYASPLGTVVLRFQIIPPRPPEFDGLCAIVGPSQDSEAELRERLERLGGKVEHYDSEACCWRARFATEEEADAAIKELEADPVIINAGGCAHHWYNDRAYPDRGWCCFESGVSTEAIARVRYYPTLAPLVDFESVPKVIDLDEFYVGPRDNTGQLRRLSNVSGLLRGLPTQKSSSAVLDTEEGAGPRIERIRKSIEKAMFTGKGDREVVLHMYTDYIKRIVLAMRATGEEESFVYEGETNEDGEEHGQGRANYSDGSVYEGEWVNGKKEGHGKICFSSGGVYEGEWKNDKQDGFGSFQYANGRVYEGTFQGGDRHGFGSYWYPPKGDALLGNVYVGEYAGDTHQTIRTVHEGGVKQGKGIYYYGDGRVYDGEYLGGEREGLGTLYYVDGRAATLRFRTGAPVGKGIQWSAKKDSTTAVRLWNGEPSADFEGAVETEQHDIAARKKAYMKKEEAAVEGNEAAAAQISIEDAEEIAKEMGAELPIREKPTRPVRSASDIIGQIGQGFNNFLRASGMSDSSA